MTPRTFIIDGPEKLANVCKFLGNLSTDTALILSVADYVPPRSLSQNSRLWMLHTKASEVTGHSAEEMHEFALMRHFGVREIVVGEIVMRLPVKRSSTRNKEEFSGFMEATEAWYINELGAWIE